ncbi:tetratricopeptide repeat protein [Dactylosporangium sp. NPDC000244]|uniref:tetratricopeptide repeat protein n=1 Tax=Dactylosporangium sp. NPDC000244 TaxID=3154365 RepID=UPI0033309D10
MRAGVRRMLVLAVRRRDRGDYRAAERLLRLALAHAESRHGRHGLPAVDIRGELGVLHKLTGRLGEAKTWYRRALRGLRARRRPDLDRFATLLHNLGGVAHAQGRHATGEPAARRAVGIRAALHGADHPATAADRAAWAALLDGCGRTEEAAAQLERALRAMRDPVEVAFVTHNLAAVRHRLGDLGAAADGYERALRLKERLLGPDHPQLAATLVGLGGARRRPEYYERAIAVLEPVVDPRHPTLAAARRGLRALREP